MAFVTLSPRIGVFFAEPETISVDNLTKYKGYMLSQHLRHAILITRNALSSPARKMLHDSKLYIESFKENELVVNITKHVLVKLLSMFHQRTLKIHKVPKHEKVFKDQAIFDPTTVTHLPKLHRGDP